MAEITLWQAASRFLASLDDEARRQAQGEVYRFVRWCGADGSPRELRGHDVSLYADSLGPSVEASRLEAVRAFLAFLKKRGLTSTNLAPHLRVRKSTASGEPGPALPQGKVDLTAEGYRALQAELESLLAQRPQVAAEVRQAMLDKDFRENAPLDAARERQAHIEARIRELEATLKQAVIVRSGERSQKVRLGSTVILRNLSSGVTLRYTIVGPNEASALEGRISSASPVGKALLEKGPGHEVEVSAPAGVMRFRIEEVLP